MTLEERMQKVRQGIELLREAEAVAIVRANELVVELVIDKLLVESSNDTYKVMALDSYDDGQQIKIDLSKIAQVRSISFRSGMPVLNMSFMPNVMEMSNIRVIPGGKV